LLASDATSRAGAAVDLYWLPLGAGGHFVRLNGRVYEALAARVRQRPACDLYHSALQVKVGEGTFVIEQAPVHDWSGKQRGVVAEGAVGSRWAGRFRIFRYEIRLWFGGHIPDVAEAVDSPRRLTDDEEPARRVLDLIGQVPTPVWGRDELATGDMWNSNSVIACDRAQRNRRRVNSASGRGTRARLAGRARSCAQTGREGRTDRRHLAGALRWSISVLVRIRFGQAAAWWRAVVSVVGGAREESCANKGGSRRWLRDWGAKRPPQSFSRRDVAWPGALAEGLCRPWRVKPSANAKVACATTTEGSWPLWGPKAFSERSDHSRPDLWLLYDHRAGRLARERRTGPCRAPLSLPFTGGAARCDSARAVIADVARAATFSCR
jgi:hypothetical protein